MAGLADTPGAMGTVGMGLRAPPSTIARDRTNRKMEKFRRDKRSDGDTSAKDRHRDSQDHLPETPMADDLNSLFYGAQTTRGAGNNPGLGSAIRGHSLAQNENPNTPGIFRGHGISPIASSFTGRGHQSPYDHTAGLTSPVAIHSALHPSAADDLMYARSMGAGLGAGSGRCGCACCRCSGSCCSARGQAEQGLWVTLFGFPQGYQDGMLKILRDRGEIVEHSYSGTNHISVKFKSPDAVADAVGLNGSILPADGLPGENYMIGVKRGAALMERADTATSKAETAKRLVTEGNRWPGASGAGTSGTSGETGKPSAGVSSGFLGRFLSELFDITDLSIRD